MKQTRPLYMSVVSPDAPMVGSIASVIYLHSDSGVLLCRARSPKTSQPQRNHMQTRTCTRSESTDSTNHTSSISHRNTKSAILSKKMIVGRIEWDLECGD